MSEHLNRLTSNLDSLVPFLALGHKEIYAVLRQNYPEWYEQDKQDSLPARLDSYQTQVAHAAFLLGFSYVEVFLADITKEAFRRRPELLPKDKQLRFSELLSCEGRRELIEMMIEKETLSLFYGSFETIGGYLKEKLSLPWSKKQKIVEAPLIRNCIIHNDAVVDQRLASISGRRIGDRISLKASSVHEFGMAVRDLARNIDAEFERRYPAV